MREKFYQHVANKAGLTRAGAAMRGAHVCAEHAELWVWLRSAEGWLATERAPTAAAPMVVAPAPQQQQQPPPPPPPPLHTSVTTGRESLPSGPCFTALSALSALPREEEQRAASVRLSVCRPLVRVSIASLCVDCRPSGRLPVCLSVYLSGQVVG